MSRPKSRIGAAGYARIMASLRDEPASVKGLIARGLVGRTAAIRILRGMHALRLVHVSGWECAPRSRPVPVFALGAGEDAAPPVMGRHPTEPRRPVQLRRVKPAAGLIAFASVVRLLQEHHSVMELAEETGESVAHLARTIKSLRRLGLVRIACWYRRPHGGRPVACYVLGSGNDASRPKPLPREAINARYKVRAQERERHLLIGQAFAANASVFQQEAA